MKQERQIILKNKNHQKRSFNFQNHLGRLTLNEEPLVLFTDGKHSLEMVPLNHNEGSIRTRENEQQVIYQEVFPDVDLRYSLTNRGIKEDIIVKKRKETYQYQFQFQLTNLELRIIDSNIIAFFSLETNEEIYRLDEMVVFDSANHLSREVRLELIDEVARIVRVSVDPAWMNQSEIRFPVIIDPMITKISSNTYLVELNNNNTEEDVFFLVPKSSLLEEEIGTDGLYMVGRKMVVVENFSREIPASTSLELTINVLALQEHLDDQKAFQVLFRFAFLKSTLLDEAKRSQARFNVQYEGRILKQMAVTRNQTDSVNLTEIVKDAIARNQTSIKIDFTHQESNEVFYYRLGENTYGDNFSVVEEDTFKIYTDAYSGLNPRLEPSIIIKYQDHNVFKKSHPIIKVENGKSGHLELNAYSGEFNFIHQDTVIKAGVLSYDLAYLYTSVLATSGKNEYGLGCGWKTSFNQKLVKGSHYINPVTKGREIKYFDALGLCHMLYERWYYMIPNTNQKCFVRRDAVYLDEAEQLKVRVDNITHDAFVEAKSDDGYSLLSLESLSVYKRLRSERTLSGYRMMFHIDAHDGPVVRYLDFKEKSNGTLNKNIVYTEVNHTINDIDSNPDITPPGWLIVPETYFPDINTTFNAVYNEMTKNKRTFMNVSYDYYYGGSNEMEFDVLFDEEGPYIYLYDSMDTIDIYKTLRDDGESAIDKTVTPSEYYSYWTYVAFKRENKTHILPIYDNIAEFEEPDEIFYQDDLKELEIQIKNYEMQVSSAKDQVIAISDAIVGLDAQIKELNIAIGRHEVQRRLKADPLLTERYASATQWRSLMKSIKDSHTQRQDYQKKLETSSKLKDKCELELKRLLARKAFLIKQQKLAVNDVIIDSSGLMYGFNYQGDLVKISDAFENTIDIIYRKDQPSFIERIETKNGITEFIYDKGKTSELLISKIIKADSNVTTFKRQAPHETFFTYLEANKNLLGMKYLLDGTVQFFDQGDLARHNLKAVHRLEEMVTQVSQSKRGKITGDGFTSTNPIQNLSITLEYHGFSSKVIDQRDTYNNQLAFFFDQDGELTGSQTIKKDYFLNRRVIKDTYVKYDAEHHIMYEASCDNHKASLKTLKRDTSVQEITQEMLQSLDEGTGLVLAINTGYNPNVDEAPKSLKLDFKVGGVIKKTYELNEIKEATILLPLDTLGVTTEIVSLEIKSGDYAAMIFNLYQGDFTVNTRLEGSTLVDAEDLYSPTSTLLMTVTPSMKTEYLEYLKGKPTVIKTIDKKGKVITTIKEYDGSGRETFTQDSEGNTKENFYNELGNLVESLSYHQKQPTDKKVTRFTYDEVGNMTRMNDDEVITYLPNTNLISEVKNTKTGAITTYTYDRITGLMIGQNVTCDDISNSVSYQYTMGLLTRASSKNIAVEYTYDHCDRILEVIVDGVLTYTYTYEDEVTENNVLGTRVTTTDVLKNVVTVSFTDVHEALRRTTINGQDDLLLTYNTAGKLINKASALSNTIHQYAYDTLDRLISSSHQVGGRTIETSCSYDESGRLFQSVVNEVQEVYTYNTDDELIKIQVEHTGQHLNKTLHLESDHQGRLTTTTLDVGGVSDFIKEELIYSQDESKSTNLIKSHTVKVLNQLPLTNRYTYDALNNIKSIKTRNESTYYTYDHLSRLIREDNKALNQSILHEYDAGGNILRTATYQYAPLSLEDDLVLIKEMIYQYQKDQLVKLTVLDTHGNILEERTIDEVTHLGKNLTFNHFNQVIGIDQHRFLYNDEGIRIKKNDTDYLVFEGRILKEITPTREIHYLYTNKKLTGFMYNNSEYFYQRNIQGDVVAIYDTTGSLKAKYTYDAYGNHIITNYDVSQLGDLNPFRYRGYYYDSETSLYYLQSRYYDPKIGRFISKDHLNYLDPKTIGGLNLYAYCGGNPVMRMDPSGRFGIPVFKIQLLNQMMGVRWNAALLPANNFKNANLSSKTETNHIVFNLEHSWSLFKGQPLLVGFIGNISYTVSVRDSDPNTFYLFTAPSVTGIKNGSGMNLFNGWLGTNVYTSTDLSIGIQHQVTPIFHYGASIGLNGIGINFGIDIGYTSHDININIGWGTTIATGVAIALFSMPEPVFTKIAASFIFVLSLFGVFN